MAPSESLLKRLKNLFTVVKKPKNHYSCYNYYLESKLDKFNIATEFISCSVTRVRRRTTRKDSSCNSSARSIYGYTGAVRNPESFTSDYAYFRRDSRRLFPATVAVTHSSVGLLPVPDKMIEAVEGKRAEELIIPGNRRVYKKSNEQPPSDGYFPIINCD